MKLSKGIFIAYGNNINQGEFIGDIDIYDITPTMLYSMGLPILNTMDGEIIERCFSLKYLEDNKPEYIKEGHFNIEKKGYKNNESEDIKNQLKGLGYI